MYVVVISTHYNHGDHLQSIRIRDKSDSPTYYDYYTQAGTARQVIQPLEKKPPRKGKKTEWKDFIPEKEEKGKEKEKETTWDLPHPSFSSSSFLGLLVRSWGPFNKPPRSVSSEEEEEERGRRKSTDFNCSRRLRLAVGDLIGQ